MTLLYPTGRADIDQAIKNHQGPGFIELASDEKSGLAPFGVNNIERLLDKG